MQGYSWNFNTAGCTVWSIFDICDTHFKAGSPSVIMQEWYYKTHYVESAMLS
jgi:hypothetical protein